MSGLGNGIKDLVNGGAKFINDVIDTVGDNVSKVIKTTGDAAEGILGELTKPLIIVGVAVAGVCLILGAIYVVNKSRQHDQTQKIGYRTQEEQMTINAVFEETISESLKEAQKRIKGASIETKRYYQNLTWQHKLANAAIIGTIIALVTYTAVIIAEFNTGTAQERTELAAVILLCLVVIIQTIIIIIWRRKHKILRNDIVEAVTPKKEGPNTIYLINTRKRERINKKAVSTVKQWTELILLIIFITLPSWIIVIKETGKWDPDQEEKIHFKDWWKPTFASIYTLGVFYLLYTRMITGKLVKHSRKAIDPERIKKFKKVMRNKAVEQRQNKLDSQGKVTSYDNPLQVRSEEENQQNWETFKEYEKETYQEKPPPYSKSSY